MKYLEKYKLFENNEETFSEKELAFAIIQNDYRKIQRYIDSGGDVNLICLKYSLLERAINQNKYKIAKMLLDNGAIINNDEIIFESLKSKPKMLKYLIKHDIDVNKKNDNYYKQTPLIYLSLYTVTNKLQKMKLLIDADADWNILDSSGKDFIFYLHKPLLNNLKKTYPEKYENYLKLKDKYLRDFLKNKKIKDFNV